MYNIVNMQVRYLNNKYTIFALGIKPQKAYIYLRNSMQRYAKKVGTKTKK